MNQNDVRRAWYHGHITGPYDPDATSQKKKSILCRPFTFLKKKVLAFVGKKPERGSKQAEDNSSVSYPIEEAEHKVSPNVSTNGESVSTNETEQEQNYSPSLSCPSVDSITIHRSRYTSHAQSKMTSLPNPTVLSSINEDPETISFNEICKSHPELEGTVIQTNVIMKPRQPRMARVMGNILKPFSSDRAEKEWAPGQKFKIGKPKPTNSDESPDVSPLSPELSPPALKANDSIHAVPLMPVMPSAQSMLPMNMKDLPPVPSMPDIHSPPQWIVPPFAPPKPISPPLAPRPSTPPGLVHQGPLTPLSNPPSPPRPSIIRSPRSPDVSFWMGRVLEIHEILGQLMVEHADVEQRRVFYNEFAALSNLMSTYNATTTNATALDKLVFSMRGEAFNQRHQMIDLVDRVQQAYNLLGYCDDSEEEL